MNERALEREISERTRIVYNASADKVLLPSPDNLGTSWVGRIVVQQGASLRPLDVAGAESYAWGVLGVNRREVAAAVLKEMGLVGTNAEPYVATVVDRLTDPQLKNSVWQLQLARDVIVIGGKQYPGLGVIDAIQNGIGFDVPKIAHPSIAYSELIEKLRERGTQKPLMSTARSPIYKSNRFLRDDLGLSVEQVSLFSEPLTAVFETKASGETTWMVSTNRITEILIAGLRACDRNTPLEGQRDRIAEAITPLLQQMFVALPPADQGMAL